VPAATSMKNHDCVLTKADLAAALAAKKRGLAAAAPVPTSAPLDADGDATAPTRRSLY